MPTIPFKSVEVTIHAIRNNLQAIRTHSEVDGDIVDIINALLKKLEVQLSCPYKEKCPMLHPETLLHHEGEHGT